MNNERPLIVKPLRRFLTFLLDIFLFFIVTTGVYSFGVSNLLKVIPVYQNALSAEKVAVEEVKNMYIDGKLVLQSKSGDVYDNDSFVFLYMDNAVKRNPYDENGHCTDVLQHFYVEYTPKLTFERYNDTVLYTSIHEVNEKIFAPCNQEGVVLFTYYLDDVNQPMILTETASENVSKYMSGNVDAVNESYYLKLQSFIKTELLNAENVLKRSDQYFSSYTSMMKNNDLLYLYTSISVTITYTFFFLIYYLLIPFFLKNGQTIGKKVMKMELRINEENGLPFSRVALRSVLQYVCYFFICVFIPIFQLGTSIVNLPLLIIGNFSLSMVIVGAFTLLLSIISFIYMCFNADHQALHDKMVGGIMYDIPALDDLMHKKAEQLELEKEKDGSQL